MPPRSPSSPPGGPRRRPAPAMPNGWVWLIILCMAALMLWFMQSLAGPKEIDYSKFLQLLHEKEVDKVTFVGKDLIEGELKSGDKADQDAQDLKLRDRKFTVRMPPVEDHGELLKQLAAAGAVVNSQPDRGSAFWSVVGFLLIPALILGLFF